jgi:hypothetical protein
LERVMLHNKHMSPLKIIVRFINLDHLSLIT